MILHEIPVLDEYMCYTLFIVLQGRIYIIKDAQLKI